MSPPLEQSTFKLEALVSLSLCFVIITIVIISMVSSDGVNTMLKEEGILAEFIDIEISGDVKKPKKYNFPAGITYGEAIFRAKPKRSANLDEWDLEKKIFISEKIAIKKLQSIRVTVTGEVNNPGEFMMDVDSKVCDLKKKLQLLAHSDITALKSRRYLKHREKIHIPKK